MVVIGSLECNIAAVKTVRYSNGRNATVVRRRMNVANATYLLTYLVGAFPLSRNRSPVGVVLAEGDCFLTQRAKQTSSAASATNQLSSSSRQIMHQRQCVLVYARLVVINPVFADSQKHFYNIHEQIMRERCRVFVSAPLCASNSFCAIYATTLSAADCHFVRRVSQSEAR